MIFKKSELSGYQHFKDKPEFIPVNIWNKQKKDKKGKTIPAGKMPLQDDWTTKKYKADAYSKWIKSGLNIGYRIKEREVVLDLDPRNYEGVNIEQLVAEHLGYFDFEELLWDNPVVKTGGGGYHIYYTLPFELEYKQLKEVVEEFPGVEVKKKGRQVLCPGCKHPNGKFYTWINQGIPKELPESFYKKFERTINPSKGDYFSGKGALTGVQLKSLILDKLDPSDYDTNNSWFPLLCSAHHATEGEGIEEFVSWSLEDDFYEDHETLIRTRWESLSEKENNITVGTLIGELKKNGEDTSAVKAVINFSHVDDNEDDSEDDDPDKNEFNEDVRSEAEIINNAKEVAAKIDISELLNEPDIDEEVEGRALEYAQKIGRNSSDEEIMKCLRLIKAASTFESAKAQDILIDKKVLKRPALNKLLKELDKKIVEDLALLISNKTLERVFNEGKYVTNTPTGQLWMYKKTHWVPISDEFLGKMTKRVVSILKEKMDISAPEMNLISQAVKLTRIEASTLTDRIHRTTTPLSVINCKNGELWMKGDGTHILKSHSYRSYLINCLNVNYDPSAECPLFMQTLREIFRDYEDTEELVRHIGEIFGYIIQPFKNIASWWLFKGPGGDGKSTLLKILGAILQDAQLAGSVKLLNVNSDTGDNHATTSLIGKLNLAIEELPHGYTLKDSTLKLLSETTKMEANPKNKDRFHFTYCAGLIMCSNRYPRTKDLSHAMARRANVINFNRQFTQTGEEDLGRVEKILKSKEEMSGILNFMLEGLQRLRNRGHFDPPKSCQVAKEDWLEQSNNLFRFVRENIDRSKNDKAIGSLKDIYEIRYQLWCQDNDMDNNMRLKKSNFKIGLEELGFKVERSTKHQNKIMVFGGELLDNDLEEEEWF